MADWIHKRKKGVVVMDIERLRELKEQLASKKFDFYGRQNIRELIDEAIARQSVTSEEVAEAILLVEELAEIHVPEWRNEGSSMKVGDDCSINECLMTLAITALQAYQPWIPVSERLPESGRHVLLCCEIRPSGKRYVCDGYYAKPKSITSGYSNDWDCEYDEETDEYYLPEGYYEIIKNWGEYSSIVIEDFVVAWKPLPEPLKGECESGVCAVPKIGEVLPAAVRKDVE